MNDAKTKISNTLFNNRQLFLRYNQFKINRILETLSATDRLVFTLIPRLLHINQKGLPGYIQAMSLAEFIILKSIRNAEWRRSACSRTPL